ncbi:MAG: hypothetical protein IIA06_13120 [Proteobacteria bacterium]|nr:hypothetical protein [Pseudomonadota bacterium]
MIWRQQLFSIIILLLTTVIVVAQDSTTWRIEGGITISHFQQQVKSEIGGLKGDELVNNFEFGFIATGTYEINEFFAAGIFTRFDTGERNMAIFDGFDEEGRAEVKNKVGGSYSEFWFGPMIRGMWKQFSLDVGYAPVGIRKDDARTDLPSSSGSTSDSFETHPTIAWLIALGGNIPVGSTLDIFIKVEYRVRYYNKRGGENLEGDVKLGTQSIAPVIGVTWHL